MIDEAVAKAEVDGTFLKECYKLKKQLEKGVLWHSIALAVLTGVLVTLAINIQTATLPDGTAALPSARLLCSILLLSTGTATIAWIFRPLALTREHFLKSYLLHRMEEKLDEDAHLHTDDKES